MPNKTKKRTVTLDDYQKAMDEIHEKNKGFKSQNRHIVLFITFLIIGILLYVSSDKSIALPVAEGLRLIASKALIPYIISVSAFYLVYFSIKLIKSLRCPHCRGFFPKGELELFDSFQNTGVSISSQGDSYFRPTSTSAYWTECRYCGHLLWVVKGG